MIYCDLKINVNVHCCKYWVEWCLNRFLVFEQRNFLDIYGYEVWTDSPHAPYVLKEQVTFNNHIILYATVRYWFRCE